MASNPTNLMNQFDKKQLAQMLSEAQARVAELENNEVLLMARAESE
jgi:hypothetical protein